MDGTACCNCAPVVETRFDGDRERAPSIAIIEAVAAAEGVAPTELDPIYDEIDPETIDKLFAGQTDRSKFLRFSISGWNIFVRGDGALRVCDPDRRTDKGQTVRTSHAD